MVRREEDVSKTMYMETVKSAVGIEGEQLKLSPDVNSKVNTICDAFLDALKHRTSTHFQNVITAHVCKSPPDLDAGLAQIAGLRSAQVPAISRILLTQPRQEYRAG